MTIDAWLPIGFTMPSGESVRLAQFDDVDWQIYEAEGGGRVLVAQPSLAERWLSIDLLESGALEEFALGTQTYFALTSKSGYTLAPVSSCNSTSSKTEAIAFVQASLASRARDETSPLNDA